MEITKEQDQAMSRSIDAHDEHRIESLKAGQCPKCKSSLCIEENPRNLTIKCDAGCGWSARYPIRTIGNSERAQRDENLIPLLNECRRVIMGLVEQQSMPDDFWKQTVKNIDAALTAQRDESLDPVAQSEREVIEAAKKWRRSMEVLDPVAHYSDFRKLYEATSRLSDKEREK